MSLPFLVDAVLCTTVGTPGTGTLTLGSAFNSTYRGPAALSNAVSYSYTIFDADANGNPLAGGGREWGSGTYTASGTTFSRDTVTGSTNGNAKVNFQAGAMMFITPTAELLYALIAAGSSSPAGTAGQIQVQGYASDTPAALPGSGSDSAGNTTFGAGLYAVDVYPSIGVHYPNGNYAITATGLLYPDGYFVTSSGPITLNYPNAQGTLASGNGNLRVAAGLMDHNGSLGNAGDVFTSDGADGVWSGSLDMSGGATFAGVGSFDAGNIVLGDGSGAATFAAGNMNIDDDGSIVTQGNLSTQGDETINGNAYFVGNTNVEGPLYIGVSEVSDGQMYWFDGSDSFYMLLRASPSGISSNFSMYWPSGLPGDSTVHPMGASSNGRLGFVILTGPNVSYSSDTYTFGSTTFANTSGQVMVGTGSGSCAGNPSLTFGGGTLAVAGSGSFAPAAASTGTPNTLVLTPGNDSPSAGANASTLVVNGVTKKWATGTVSAYYANQLGADTLTANGASTFPVAATLYVPAPVVSTNVTATNLYSAILAGSNLLGGQIIASATGSLSSPQFTCGANTGTGWWFQSGEVDLAYSSISRFRLDLANNAVVVSSAAIIAWTANDPIGGSYDTALKRVAALVVGPTNGSAAAGWFQNTAGRARTGTVTNATATMANLSNLTVTLIAGRKYTGFLVAPSNNSTAAEGLQFDFGGGSATFTTFEAGFSAVPPGGGIVLGTLTAGNSTTALTATTASTGDAFYTIPIVLVTGAAGGGTFIPRFAEVSHTLGTAQVTNAWLWLEDMPN